MATQEEIITKVGSHLLFLGVETIYWNDSQWASAASFCRSHDISSAIIKIADGGNAWFSSTAAFKHVIDIFYAHGVGVIPYMYSYANKFNYLDGEITNIMIPYMERFSVFCLDTEVEYNNNVAAASHVASRLKPIPGILLASVWGDPAEQASVEVLKALSPCVDAFMPQQYSNWLATRYWEFNGISTNIQPTVDLSQEAGANDPVNIARAAYARGSRILSIWEYQFAVQSPSLLDAVLRAFPKTQVQTPPTQNKPPVAPVVPPTVHPQPISQPNEWQQADAASEWSSTAWMFEARKEAQPRTGTGICHKWLEMLLQGKRLGGPVGNEVQDKDWNGKPRTYQKFESGRIELIDGVYKAYDSRGGIA